MDVKEKYVLWQIQQLFCPRDLLVSSDPRSAPPAAKKPFFLKSHMTRWLLSLGNDTQLDTELILVDSNLILVDSELTLNGFVHCDRCPAGCGCWHWHQALDTMYNCFYCQRQTHILFKKPNCQHCWALLLGSRMTNTLCLSSVEDLYCQPWTLQYWALPLVQKGLNSSWNGFWKG